MKLQLSEATLQEAVRRLAHFVPMADPATLLNPMDVVIETALFYETPGKPFTTDELQRTLVNAFGLTFEPDELSSSLERLTGVGKVRYQSDVNTWTATKIFVDTGVATLDARRAAEDAVYAEWLSHIDQVCPGLPAKDKTQLCEDLKRFVAKIFLRHGAECIALIQGTSLELEDFLNKLGPTLPAILPSRRAQMNALMLQEFPAFFLKAPTNRKKYLADLLDSAFALFMVNVDDAQSSLFKETLDGVTLYLDTNVIYRLYGINGSSLRISAKRLLSLSKSLGARLVVSPRTIRELLESLNTSERSLRASARLPRDLAAVGGALVSREDFVTAYWREYGKSGIPVDDFIELYRHPEDLLNEEGIIVVDDDLNESTLAPTVRDEVGILNSVTGSKKPPEVAEHDAIHRILIRHLRQGQGTTYADTKYWFLTVDSSLHRYDLVARRRQGVQGEAPFCIQANHWLQLIRPMQPRATDYDETFVDLLSSPYLRPSQALTPDLALKILARIALYKEHSPELAVKALTNSYLTNRLRRAQSESEEIELIDSAASEAAEGFRVQRDHIKTLLEAKEAKIEEMAAESNSALDNLEAVQAEKALLAEQLNMSRGEVSTLRDVMDSQQQRRDRIVIFVRWALAIILWLAGGIGVWKILMPPSLNKIHYVGATVTGLVSLLLGAWIPLGFSRAWKIIAVLAVILSVLSSVLNLSR